MDNKDEGQISNVERLKKEREGKSSSAVDQLQKEREGKERYFKSGGGFDGKAYPDTMKKRDEVRSELTEENKKKYEEKDTEKIRKQNTPSKGGSSGRGGGSPTVKEPDEMIKEKNDVINPEETLSKKQDGKQQKQETQQQQAQHKASGHEKASPSKISPREWMTKTLASNSPKETEQENHIAVAKDRVKTNIKGLIDKSIAEKENAPNPKTNSKEKNHEIALNSAKSPSPKSIKR
jgi:hypothetical protein